MKNVLLVFGGKSYEHDISVVTASQIYSKTEFDDIKIVPLYVSRENKFFVYLKTEFDLKDFADEWALKDRKKFVEVAFVSSQKGVIFKIGKLGLKEFLRAENAVFACHGNSGEDGRLVSVFEGFGIKCSAGNFDSLAVCMNKFLFKQVMKGMKIPVVAGFKLSKSDYGDKEYARKLFLRLRFMKFPVVIKPVSGGSSIGLFVARNIDDFKEMVDACFEFDNEIVIEKFIKNAKEYNVAVIGVCDNFTISKIDEPIKESEVLSFADKYLSGSKTKGKVNCEKGSMVSQGRAFPIDLPKEVHDSINYIAAKIFKQLNLCGVVRIDFLCDEQNRVYVCEVNSIPGSLAYYFFDDNKILLNDFILKLIKISEDNFALKSKFNKDFVTKILN